MYKQPYSERFIEKTWAITVILMCLFAMAIVGSAKGAQSAANYSGDLVTNLSVQAAGE
jgi:hypothetical protein